MTATPVATIGPVASVVEVADATDLARRLGYDRRLLAAVPTEAVESFSGVGNPLRVARLHPGERVLVLGSGSGTDVFAAALCVGPAGRVVGRDLAPAGLATAELLRASYGLDNVELSDGPIESLPFADDSFDVVVANGVVANGVLNLATWTVDVFAEVARVLRTGGRIALSDIVIREDPLPSVVAGDDLWVGRIGGAARLDDYRALLAGAGFEVLFARRSDSALVTARAVDTVSHRGVEGVTILASCC